MKLALYQGAPTDGDIDGAFDRIEKVLSAAGAMGAGMAVFPELFLPGYNRPDLHSALSQEQGADWERRLAELCRVTGVGLTLGWAERDGDKVFNAASCFHHTGAKLAHYRKVQLFGPMEAASFVPGGSYCTFDMGGFRAALLICYDVEFAHHVTVLSRRGVDLLLVPTANPAGFENVADVLVPARAFENAITVVYANYHGSEAGLAFGGHSAIVGPDGNPLARAGTGEALLIADLAHRDTMDATLLSTQKRDRREIE
ncbi:MULTISPECIES: carbon-nitrogen hydrolase family protein [unclassified Mameliella]|uniref:carbon-nitrogen hydrolase family protein n=1 Tax=unclassified Mameliella TaxID=2630630 RepID=UPI002740152F|nr:MULTISPECIES: carbon-nitrogen hydrolase family protein [unclassified Mameliella]